MPPKQRQIKIEQKSALAAMQRLETRSDEELMADYVAGDERAFNELFRRLAPPLLAILRRRFGRAADADDLLQQTFLQLHRARRDFRPGTRLRPWVMTIAMNVARDHLRRCRRRPEARLLDDSIAAPAPEPEPDPRVAIRVRTALGGLPASQREIIEQHFFEKRPYEQIASALGSSACALRVRAHRGYLTLRRALA